MKNKLATVLSKLIENAIELEENIIISPSQSKEEIEYWVTILKNKVQVDNVVFENKKNSLKNDAKVHWDEVKTNFEQGVVKVQLDFRTTKYDPNSGTPSLRADWAEDDAELSIYIALKALSNAEELIIIALKERAKANSFE